MTRFVLLLASSLVALSLARAQPPDSARWKQYFRGGVVQADVTRGGNGYYRLNRRTGRHFNDLRLFSYLLKEDSFIYLRYKNSRRWERLRQLYSFTTVAFQKNTRAGVNLRYHYNQGIGYFLTTYPKGHITTELGHAYDMSNYLNDTRKSSYLKGGFYWDHDGSRFSTKLEVEYFHQISEIVITDLTRTQTQLEVILPLRRRLSQRASTSPAPGRTPSGAKTSPPPGHGWALILGYEQEFYPGQEQQDPSSIYLALEWRGDLAWRI